MSELWKVWNETKSHIYTSKHSTYSRSTGIDIGMSTCEICKELTVIMSIDSSDGEYNNFDCCRTCFENLWKKYVPRP